MYQTFIVFLICCLPLLSFAQESASITRTLRFATDRHQLLQGHQEDLNFLVDTLKEVDFREILVSGHTDNIGNMAYNKALSERRARSVSEFLIRAGVPKDKVRQEYRAYSAPIASNDHPKGRALNRRVEVSLHYLLPQPEVDTIPQVTEEILPIPTDSIHELYQESRQIAQEYCIFPERDTVIRCEKGSIIYIKAGTFAVDGEVIPGECVTLEVKEVFLKSEMILENVTTTSDGRPLESQGMIYTNATYQDQQAEILPGKDLVIMIPTDKVIPGAQIFDGERTGHDSILNWVPAPQSDLSNFALGDLYWCSNFLDGTTGCDCWRKFRNFFRRLFKKDEIPPFASSDSTDIPPQPCPDLQALFEKYGVDDIASLIDAINAPLYEQYDVDNPEDLAKALKKERLENIELDYKGGKLAMTDFQYYVFNTPELGWKNVDIFADFKRSQLTTLKVNLKPGPDVDCKLVFKRRNTVIPATPSRNQYEFAGVPLGERAWLVALKIKDDKYSLSMQPITIEKKIYTLNWEEVSLDELKLKLKVLDR